MKDILGVVLCGGKSKRMGSDKGLKKIDDKTWAEHIAAVVVQLVEHVFVVVWTAAAAVVVR